MNMEEWIEILQTVGVPSVVCAASFYYIFKKDIWSKQNTMPKNMPETDKQNTLQSQNLL